MMESRKASQSDLDVSQISHISNASVREQPSQLDINVNGYLHSTFNYPLHSTVNFMDMSLDLSKTIANESDTLVDSKYTMESHNVNVIGGSTVHTEERSGNLSSDTTVTATSAQNKSQDKDSSKNKSGTVAKSKSVLSKDSKTDSGCHSHEQSMHGNPQESPKCDFTNAHQPLTQELLRSFDEKMKQTQNWVDTHGDLNWGADGDSDCDSSCLSFNVDDVSFSLYETVADSRNLSPAENNKKTTQQKLNNNSKAVPTITDIISQHLWGSFERTSEDVATGNGTCNVCKLLRLKRQQGCTDLWTNPGEPPRGDQSSWYEHSRADSKNYSAYSFVDHFSTAHELLHDRMSRKKRPLPVGESFYQSPKRRNTMSHQSVTPKPSLLSSSQKSSRSSASKSKRRSQKLRPITGELKNFVNPLEETVLYERLAPEGCDDKENSPGFTMPSSKINKQRKSALKSSPLNACLSGVSLPNSVNAKKTSATSQAAVNKCLKTAVSAKNVYKSIGDCFGSNTDSALMYSLYENTPSLPKSRKNRPVVPSSTVKSYSDLTTQSPWATDKELKRRLKRLSKSLQSDKENVHLQPLGCI